MIEFAGRIFRSKAERDVYRALDYHTSHKRVFTAGYRIEQEVLWKNIFTQPGQYKSCKVDFFVRDLGLVIAVHGAQHYELVQFGQTPDFSKAVATFRRQLKRDIALRENCEIDELHLLEIDARSMPQYQNKDDTFVPELVLWLENRVFEVLSI